MTIEQLADLGLLSAIDKVFIEAGFEKINGSDHFDYELHLVTEAEQERCFLYGCSVPVLLYSTNSETFYFYTGETQLTFELRAKSISEALEWAKGLVRLADF